VKVLQFSGGIDSLAALFVKRPEWEDITVLWCDTGAGYPDTKEFMEKVAALVPNFRVVTSSKDQWAEKHGIAVDVVPERYTTLGGIIYQTVGPRYTSPFHCCAANIWAPLERVSRELGAKWIIRGQRMSDVAKAPIRSGHMDILGIQYEFPIEDWSRERVMAYCEEVCPELIPAYYQQGEGSSHDCWNCIAYLNDNVQRIRNLPSHEKEVVDARLHAYADVLQLESSYLTELTNG
jgi:phosphoadenosine phosphosulfate reductase